MKRDKNIIIMGEDVGLYGGAYQATRGLSAEFGTAMVYISHNLGLILNTCDRVTVINFGEKIAEAPPEAVSRDRRTIEAYLGKESVT